MRAGDIVVLTGGTGFVGSFLAEEFLRRGMTVRVPFRRGYGRLERREGEIDWMKGDVRDDAFCERLLDGAGCLFHLASHRKNVAAHRERANEIAADNARMSLALSRAVARRPFPVTFVSTASVSSSLPLASVAEERNADGYVRGKAGGEMAWMTAASARGFPLLLIRPVGIYGPRDTFSAEGNVIPSLMVKAAAARETLDVWGSGDAWRAFLYAEDAVHAILSLSDARATGVQYVYPPETVTIRELAEMIRDLVHPGLSLRFDSTRPEGTPQPRFPALDSSLRGFAWIRLADGLRRTYEWWRMSKKS